MSRRLVQFSEIRQTTRGTLTPHDQMARLKTAFDPGKEWLPINPKMAPQYEARNVLMGWLTSQRGGAAAPGGGRPAVPGAGPPMCRALAGRRL